jgi:hypothetical protein
MRRLLLMVFSLLIPLAFSGGYMLATDNAWDTCLLQVPEGHMASPQSVAIYPARELPQGSSLV